MTTRPLLIACIAFAAATDSIAQETTASTDEVVYVAANGVDGSSCGSKAAPCRSISFGIANAAPGATILVGPGRYGNLDRDGVLSGPGEETGSSTTCNCMVLLDKQVRIFSTHGPAVTVLDASELTLPTIAIMIRANGAQLGRRQHGFLLKGASNYTGVYLFNVTHVRVAGNIATAAATGFFTDSGRDNILEYNLALSNLVGFELGGIHQIVRFNQSSSNIVGFVVTSNEARLTGNIASANDDTGFLVAASGAVLTQNLTTGHRLAGFRVDDGATAAIVRNNIYGNFCGILNRSGNTINGARNYWGAASGPGPAPADRVCDDEFNDITVFKPFSATAIPMPVKTGPGG